MIVTDMVEYDEYLNKFTQKDALIRRIRIRLSLDFKAIAYYPFGLYSPIFTLTPDSGDIRAALRDITPNAKISNEKGRVTVTTVDVSVEV